MEKYKQAQEGEKEKGMEEQVKPIYQQMKMHIIVLKADVVRTSGFLGDSEDWGDFPEHED